MLVHAIFEAEGLNAWTGEVIDDVLSKKEGVQSTVAEIRAASAEVVGRLITGKGSSQ